MLVFLLDTDHVGTLCLAHPEFRLPEKTDVYHKWHCIYSLATLNHPYQLGSDGNVPQFQNCRCQPEPILQACLSQDHSLRPAMSSEWLSKPRIPPCGGWQAAISPLNLSHYKELVHKGPQWDPFKHVISWHLCPQISPFIQHLFRWMNKYIVFSFLPSLLCPVDIGPESFAEKTMLKVTGLM